MAKAKKIEAPENPDQIVFTDPTKHKRALGIVDVLNGKRASAHLKGEYSDPGAIEEVASKFKDFLADAKIEATNIEKAVIFVYQKLGGAVSTIAKQKRIRAAMKKVSDSKAAIEAGEEDPEDPDEPKDDDEDEPADKDEE